MRTPAEELAAFKNLVDSPEKLAEYIEYTCQLEEKIAAMKAEKIERHLQKSKEPNS